MPVKDTVHPKIEIEKVAAEGRCIARIGGKLTFVKGVAPGDIVDLRVTGRHKSFQEARVTAFHKKSALRTEPFCRHFGDCGGCQWQHLPYAYQLEFKRQQVADQMERIGKLGAVQIPPTLPSLSEQAYRNKLEFAFSTRRWLTETEIKTGAGLDRRALGFHVPGRFDAVIDIAQCHLQSDFSNAIRNGLRKFALDNNLEFYDLKQHKGFLRGLIIRNNRDGEFLVLIQFSREDAEAIRDVMEFLADTFPQITSLHYTINAKKNDSYYDLPVVHWGGAASLSERLGPLRFRIAPKSFFQTNPEQAERLFACVVDMAGLRGAEKVLDLYTGTGTIALYMANLVREVTGIDSIPEAIEDARRNAAENAIANARFVTGDLTREDVRNQLLATGSPDVVVVDPPRAGLHPAVTALLPQLQPEKIVYVSCNPATQARDLMLLREHFEPVAFQPIDMFPHTQHVENIALLKRR
jgi:23S rRNA (uracil1939-C5)-methyltransferase